MNHNCSLRLLMALLVTSVMACGSNVSHAEELTKRDTKVRDLTFDDIKFEMKTGSPFKRDLLTKTIEALDGKQIKIRGYMLPSFQQRGIKQFVLVRDNMECCFGPGAALYDCIVVEMAKGDGVKYTVRPVTVEGKFAIREFKADGKHLAIYQMDGLKVK